MRQNSPDYRMDSFFVFIVVYFEVEDVIRDATVTGVQTCALPIYRLQPGGPLPEAAQVEQQVDPFLNGDGKMVLALRANPGAPLHFLAIHDRAAVIALEPEALRSEERRVGKAGGWRWRWVQEQRNT